MPNLIGRGTSNNVKKQLNDLWLSFSFYSHKDLYRLAIDDVTGEGAAAQASGTNQIRFEKIEGNRPYEWKPADAPVNSEAHNGLAVDGEAVMLVVRRPVGEHEITVSVPYRTKAVSGTLATTEVKIKPFAGKNMATFLAASGTPNIPLKDIIVIGDGSETGGFTVKGARPGDNFKFMTVPSKWEPQSFVRAITPNLPKNFTEVADHFDGAADTIRSTVINGLTLQKVYEDIPGSFMVLTDRTVTVMAETKELDRSNSSETHYFTGVRGTGRVTFNQDAESITEFEASMIDWITISG